jgi:enoyl-CoA hydratase/carnithine racemase
MGRNRALEVLLSAEDYDAQLAEEYGWINRALPADELSDFVRSLAHRIAGFPASTLAMIKERVNAIALAPAEDSVATPTSSVRPCAAPRLRAEPKRRWSGGSRRRGRN